jgi:phage shock protein PspC (stress-responsive transcriptional regulator)
MTVSGEGQRAARIVRARDGRLLGGVCAGLPDIWGIGSNGRRLLFVLAGLCGGIGVVAYLACWLVIPAEDHDPDADPVRSIVLLAWAAGGLAVLVLVAAGAAAATVFGQGWVVFGLAAGVVVVSLGPLRARIPSVAALLTLAALTLPAVAVALSPLRLSLRSGDALIAPRSYGALERTTYRSGFGTMLIDLRRTPLIAPGARATLRIDAGLRRTIVALPQRACVRVRVNYDIHLFPAHLAALLTGRELTEFHDLMLFGQPYGYGAALGTAGTATYGAALGAPVPATRPAHARGPLLTIDFTSQGGGLYVRDYPTGVDPETAPNWPGFPVRLESRPYVRGARPAVRRRMLAGWHRRLIEERASQLRVNRDMPGPCGA